LIEAHYNYSLAVVRESFVVIDRGHWSLCILPRTEAGKYTAITGKWHRIIATTAMIRVRTSTRSEEEMIDALTTFNCERFGMD